MDSAPGRAKPSGAAVENRWSERRVEQIIGRLLQIGVLLAAAVVGAGALLLLARHGHAPADFRQFRPEASPFTTVAGIVRGALRLDSRGIVQLGIVLLLATPVARVALTLIAFGVQRDRLYVAITAFVLALLIYSVAFGGA